VSLLLNSTYFIFLAFFHHLLSWKIISNQNFSRNQFQTFWALFTPSLCSEDPRYKAHSSARTVSTGDDEEAGDEIFDIASFSTAGTVGGLASAFWDGRE
jgi:hypothetical protein